MSKSRKLRYSILGLGLLLVGVFYIFYHQLGTPGAPSFDELAKQDSASAVASDASVAAAAQRATMDRDGTVHVPKFTIPLSIYLSEPARRSVMKAFAENQNPKRLGIDSNASISEIRRVLDQKLTPLLRSTESNYSVRIESQQYGRVSTLVVTPEHGVTARNRHRILINLHGGGFEFGGGGTQGLLESIPIAAVGQFRVLTVDYSMGPEHIFPAASVDVAAIYRELLKEYPARNIGLYGCSSGGTLVAQVAAWLQRQGLPTPGAIGLFGSNAFADFSANPQAPGSWGGDSTYITTAVQGGIPLPVLRPSHGDRSQLPYLARADLTDPLVSPAYAPEVLAKFPSTLLVTGTRAYDMSAAVQTQRKLRKVGVEAQLELWDGLGHCFFLDSELPESKEMFEVVTSFFDKHLDK